MKNEDAEFLERAFAFFVLIILISSGAFAQQIPKTKPKIEIINGVKTIKNPAEPLYGEITLDLKENLSIGREDDEHYAFFKDVGLNVDHEGNIYVFDRANLRIQKFDKDGQYLLTIGRKGQGPGEFQYFGRSYIDLDDSLYAGNRGSINVFEKSGRLRKTIVLDSGYNFVKATADGRLIVSTLTRYQDPSKYTDDILLIDSQGKTLKKIAGFDMPRLSMAGKVAVGALDPYRPALHARALADDLGAYGFSSEYKVIVIDSSGEIVHVIEKMEAPEGISPKEKDEVIDQEMEFFKSRGIFADRSEVAKVYNFPSHKSYFYGLFSDDLGDLFVLKIRKGRDGKRESFYDLFDKGGNYVFRAIIKERLLPEVIANKCIYCVRENETAGLYEIKRYEIKNWGQIEANQ